MNWVYLYIYLIFKLNYLKMFMDDMDKKYFSFIMNNINILTETFFSYLNFLSSNSEKNEFSFNFNKSKSLMQLESNENENDEQISKKAKNFLVDFHKEMSSLNGQLEDFGKYYEKNTGFTVNYRNYNELIALNNNFQKMAIKSILCKQKTQKNELIYIMFKQIIDSCHFSIVENTLKLDIKSNYIIRKKIKQETIPNNNIETHIKTKINNYIKNVFKNNIEFNFDSKGFMSIKYLPLIIIIGMPLKDIFSLKHKITININFINSKKENINSLLIEKLKLLIENRIISLLGLMYDEKKAANQKQINFSEQNLLDFIVHLLNYLLHYNNIFMAKCAFCGHISKYSYKEKCFFPPYYKLFKLNKIGINENENLFFHEDCFARISNPSL